MRNKKCNDVPVLQRHLHSLLKIVGPYVILMPFIFSKKSRTLVKSNHQFQVLKLGVKGFQDMEEPVFKLKTQKLLLMLYAMLD